MAAASSSTAARTDAPIVIRFDGSVRSPEHHETPSAAVGYIIEQMGQPVAENSARLAYWRSNTHVEYDALIAALEHALELGFSGHVTVRGDAKSVLQVVDPAAHPTPNDRVTARYAKTARRLLNAFTSVSLRHVKREANATADDLAARGHSSPTLIHP